MDLRQLRYFVAVAEAGSISRAAEKLFIAQPPLSLQIAKLEAALGARLFERHARGVRPTAAALALLPEARALLDRAARLRDRLRGTGGPQAPPVRLGVVPSALSTVLPRLAARLEAGGDGPPVEPSEAISAEQVDGLLAGRLDAAIVRGVPRHARLAVGPSLADPFVLAVPQRRAPRPRRTVALRDFADADFVAFTRHRGPAYFDRAIHACARAGFSPRIRVEASTVHGVLGLVGAGFGVALVPATAVLLRAPHVVLLPLATATGAERLAWVERRGDPSPAIPVVRTAVAEVFAAIAADVADALARSARPRGTAAARPARREAPSFPSGVFETE